MAWNRKTLSAASVMFLATFCSTVALGSCIARHTEGRIGLSEYLLMNGIAGMAHALLGCQPLLILRPTGPITLILTQLYALSKLVEVDFFTLVAWTGVGVASWMTAIAGLELSRHIAMLSCFAHDVFAVFVSSIYVVDGVVGVVGRFQESAASAVVVPLFALCITLALVSVAFFLTYLRHVSHVLPRSVRFLLSDYALCLATVTATALSYACAEVEVERISIADTDNNWMTVEPTFVGRPWMVPLLTTPNATLAAVAGFLVAIPITVFFYFDQNFSSLLCQSKDMKLTKGAYYDSSFLWMAVFNLIGPLFGLPFVTGSLPHSPQMVRALTNDENDAAPPAPAPTHEKDGEGQDSQEGESVEAGGSNAVDGDGVVVVDVAAAAVCENRVAPFATYALILLSYLVFSDLIQTIPVAAADAVLIFVGLEGIFDTRLWRRLSCLVTPDRDCSPDIGVPSAARRFTLLQLAVLAAGWLLNFTPAALAFPLVIALLVPIRTYVLPSLFSPAELTVLDGPEEHAGMMADFGADDAGAGGYGPPPAMKRPGGAGWVFYSS
eukprot:CAMPEP_0167798886 /NCGR_PEP_ID=MMETSP0111_2-20121227/16632_1 /TAXON_ID=91324 /ORGANISM="Lotharella globosa, Strain CCCM811" /LENGTH=551 /DNA_ID=CAMNT_0007693499 /DNA_START=53 /DNA_END=1708 /DNA_ORIENTATION=+